MGRPTKYKKIYCKRIIKYFNIEPYTEKMTTTIDKKGKETVKIARVPCDLPLFQSFARSIGATVSMVDRWRKKYKEFGEAYNEAKAMQESIWFTNSSLGLYNAAFTIFAGKNMFGWRDKQEVDHTTGGEKIAGFNYVIPENKEVKNADPNPPANA